MLVRLAIETRPQQAHADAERLAAMELTTCAAYRGFLARVYGFEVGVERALGGARDLDPAILRSRTKAALLRHDLATLGLGAAELDALPLATNLPIQGAGQAFGWLFVVERHTLLAGQLKRSLQHTLGAAAAGAFSYLGAYGDTPGARFRELGELISRSVGPAASPQAIVAAAEDAFRSQRQWYRTSGTTAGRHPAASAARLALAPRQ